jgi:hypothetical protein
MSHKQISENVQALVYKFREFQGLSSFERTMFMALGSKNEKFDL